MFHMEHDSRPLITVTPDELEQALRVWCRVAPKRMWADFIRHAETTQKWSAGGDPFNRFDPNHAFAAYLRGKFEQAKWTVTYPQPVTAMEAEVRARKLRGAEG